MRDVRLRAERRDHFGLQRNHVAVRDILAGLGRDLQLPDVLLGKEALWRRDEEVGAEGDGAEKYKKHERLRVQAEIQRMPIARQQPATPRLFVVLAPVGMGVASCR